MRLTILMAIMTDRNEVREMLPNSMAAFSTYITIRRDVVHHVKPLHSMRPNLVRAAAHPPRRIGNVVKDLRQALQSSLEARTSRIELTLPFGAKLGTEKREDNEGVITQRTAGDRELARIVAAMFEGTGLKVCVMFATEGERAAAVRAWGPTAKCDIVAWAGKSKTTTTSKGKGAGFTFGKKDKDKQSPKGGFGKPATSQPQADLDVYIAVGGGAGFLARIRGLGQALGMDKLIIIANGNSGDETLPVDLQRYLEEEFEAVYYYKPNPHPNWSGGVLFRKFPDEWVLCRLAGMGMLQELIKKKVKPSMDEIANVLSKEDKKGGNEILKKISKLVDFGG